MDQGSNPCSSTENLFKLYGLGSCVRGNSLTLNLGADVQLTAWQLVNALGQPVLTGERLQASGNHPITIPTQLAAGIYHLILQTNTGTQRIKLMVQ